MRIIPKEDWTLTDVFLERVRLSPQAKAYRWYDGKDWVDMTWAEAASEVGRWQAALAKEKSKTRRTRRPVRAQWRAVDVVRPGRTGSRARGRAAVLQ